MSKFVTANRFAALDSDAEDGPAVTSTKKPAEQQPQQANASQQQQQQRRPRDLPRSRAGADDSVATDLPQSVRGSGAGNTRPVRERRNNAGAGGAAGSRRDFERHSGTGRGREMKKHGGGAHNWGSVDEESFAAGEGGATEFNTAGASPSAGDAGAAAAAAAGEGGDGGAVAEAPKEPAAIDYTEYMKQLKKKRAAINGGGGATAEDDSAARTVDAEGLEKEGFKLLHRDDEEQQQASFRGRDDSSDENGPARGARPANYIDLGSLQRRRGRGGGGAGGGRGRGENDESRSGERRREPQQKPNVADSAAFPSL